MEVVARVNQPHVTFAFVDVGQGDSTIVVLPDGQYGIVVDCPATSVTIDYLEARGIGVLSHVFITHTDADHMGGVANLLANFSGSVEKIIYNPYDHPDNNQSGTRRNVALRQIISYIKSRGADTQYLEAPQMWNIQGLQIDVLHPTQLDIKFYAAHGNPNNGSGILRFTYLEHKVLLSADVEGKGWLDVLNRNTNLQAHVLKFPHHGAWYQPTNQQPSLEEILDQINPSLVIISVGSNNTYNHPNLNTLRMLFQRNLRLICTQPTPQCHSIMQGRHNCGGTVEVHVDTSGISISPNDAGHQG